MTKRYSTILRALLLALAVQFSLAGIADAQCLNSQQTRQAIKNNQVVSISAALRRAGLKDVRVASAELCPPYYIVSVLKNDGTYSTHRIQAMTGRQ